MIFDKKNIELKKSIKALGTVNTAAIEDYRDVSTRYNELSAQCSNLCHGTVRTAELFLCDGSTDCRR